jgi:hypothetical protein
MLPKVNLPIHTLILPSSGEKVLFRPLTVHDEKLLLMAIDDEDDVQMLALRQVINNCLLPNEKGKTLDVEKLAMFDLDYIWLKLRSKSIDEIVTIPFECKQPLPEGETLKNLDGTDRDYCGQIVNVPINFNTVEVIKNPENNPKIKLFEGLTVVMNYPTFEIFQKLLKVQQSNNIDSQLNIIAECIQLIHDTTTDKTYENEFMDKKELLDFLESLPQSEFLKIMKFFETLPTIRCEVHFKCPRCKYEADIVVEGTKSFLASASVMNQ